MDYGDKRLDGKYQFNRKYRETQLCEKIATELDKQCDAFEDPVYTCGNNKLEFGEECECDNGSTNCPCCRNCKVQGMCSPYNNACCTDQCTYADTSAACSTLGGDPGYCNNGECARTICPALLQGQFCGIHDDNTCKIKCTYNNKCEAMNGWTSGGNPINHTVDGAGCAVGNGRHCWSC